CSSLWDLTFEMAHGKARVPVSEEIVMIAGAHDRLHRSSVEQPIPDEAFIDVYTDDLAKGDEARGGIAVDIIEPDSPEPFALQGAGRGPDARRLDQPRRGGLQADRFHLVHTAREGPSGLLHSLAQIPDRQVADELAGLLNEGDRVLAAVAGEHHHRRIARNTVEERVRGEVDLALGAHGCDPADRTRSHD